MSNSPQGFKDNYASTANDFSYDNNGNITADNNKGIGSIIYNHLNLPIKINFGVKGEINYLYNATGQKLQKFVKDMVSNTNTTTDYLSGFQYLNTTLQFFPHAEGYMHYTRPLNNGQLGSFNYVFNYTDHLGNVRVSFANDPLQGNVLKILEENHYYPFGMKHENYNVGKLNFKKFPDTGVEIVPSPVVANESYNYKYNGKELQEELGLNMYDYGARNYDPALGRWMNIDPLAEMYRRHTPYAYAVNNPIYFLDPDGMEVKNGHQTERDDAKKNRDKVKSTFDSKYSSTGMSKKDFASKKEFKAYKSAKNDLASAESSYKSAENKFQQVQTTIDEFKAVDPKGFETVNNLKNGETGTVIDVVVKTGSLENGGVGGQTKPSVWPESFTNQELGGDGNINITLDGSPVAPRAQVLAHEFGHAVGIAAKPFDSYHSALVAKTWGRLNCQLSCNRNETFAQTAMDWQERFILLKSTMKP